MTRQLRVAVLSGLFLLSSLAMVRSVKAQNAPPMTPMPVMDQMTNIPYFTLRDGMSSTLTLQNLAPTPTKVTVTIFNTAGQAHVLDPIILDPHSFKEVQLADVAPQGFDSGNVEVAFNGTSMMVTCQVSVFSLKERVSFESREADMMDFESANLAGILSLPKGADGFLAVTSVAKNRITFQLTAGSLKKSVALFPRETQLIKLNEDESLSETTLVKLQHNGLPGDLITTGYVLNMKDGYSSGFAMLDPGINRSSVLAGAHFRAGQPGPTEGFPEGTRFSSPLLLANVSANPVVARVSVDYTVQEKVPMTPINPNDADATEDVFKKTVAVKTLTIAPGDVQRVELSDALGGVGQIAEAGVDIAYDAAPGSVIGQLTSVDQSGDYAFEVPVKDPDAMNELMESTYPWTVENGRLTVLHLKNATNKAVEAGVLILFDGGVYNPDKFELQPYQTIDLDIQKVKASKKPDVLGHVFPASATHGQLDWFQITPNTMIGRAEGTDVGAGIASSFSCQSDCCGYFTQEYTLLPYPMNGLVGGSSAFSADELYENCYGSVFYYTNQQSSATSWYSGNTSVVTVNSSGQTSFKGPGLTTVNAVFPIDYYNYNSRGECTLYPSTNTAVGTVNVNPPDHIKVLNDLNTFPQCPPGTGPAVKVRQISVNLTDVNSALVQQNYYTMETYSNPTSPTSSCPSPWNVAPKASGCGLTTTGYCPTCTGAWTDTLSVTGESSFCTSGISPASGCGFSETSTWSMCSFGLANAVWTSVRSTLSNNITVAGNSGQYPTGTILH
jgi:hypothetical protein